MEKKKKKPNKSLITQLTIYPPSLLPRCRSVCFATRANSLPATCLSISRYNFPVSHLKIHGNSIVSPPTQFVYPGIRNNTSTGQLQRSPFIWFVRSKSTLDIYDCNLQVGRERAESERNIYCSLRFIRQSSTPLIRQWISRLRMED